VLFLIEALSVEVDDLKGHDFVGYGKVIWRVGFVTVHDFSRAKDGQLSCWALAPAKVYFQPHTL
jgi:hypothetical protein